VDIPSVTCEIWPLLLKEWEGVPEFHKSQNLPLKIVTFGTRKWHNPHKIWHKSAYHGSTIARQIKPRSVNGVGHSSSQVEHLFKTAVFDKILLTYTGHAIQAT